MKRVLVCLSLLGALVAVPVASLGGVASAAEPGGVFVTGHDPDFHATQTGENAEGSKRIIQKAIDFVTTAPAPTVLLVSSEGEPPTGHADSEAGLQAAGFTPVLASAQTGTDDAAIPLETVNFANYSVVVVASDFGGILRQADLDVLNARYNDLIAYVNGGGGLVAFAESQLSGAFDFLPFLVSEVSTNESESGYTVTPYGATEVGLTDADVNGNFSHNIFTSAGELNVVDNDADGNVVTLATRGEVICSGITPKASINDVSKLEGNAGLTPFGFTVSLDAPACGSSLTVNYTTSLTGTAVANDLNAAAGSVVFAEGESAKPVVVNVVGDTNVEPDETFFVNITSTDAGIADGQGKGTILNDDTAPTTRNGTFACRASGLRLVLIEPNVANNPYNPCVDKSITTLGVNLTSGVVNVKSGTLVSTTDQTPNNLTATPPATTDMATSVSTVESADITALGLVGIKATVLRSEAKVQCAVVPGGLAPKLTSSSTIAKLVINGSTINTNGSALIQLPLGLGSVAVNRTVTTATSITQQALRVQILGIEVVVAEAKAGFTGNPCA
jgi:hypothetical protein